jgi:signal transduction histidine kinase
VKTENTPPEPDPHPQVSSGRSADERNAASTALGSRRRRVLRKPSRRPTDGRVSDISLKRRLRGVWVWPAAALLLGCLFAAILTIPTAIGMVLVTSGVQKVSIPAVRFLGAASDERTLSLQYLVTAGSDRRALDQQRARTDELLGQVQQAADAQWIIKIAPPAEPIKVRLEALLDRSSELNVLRARIDGRQLNQDEIYAAYNAITDAGGAMFDTQARIFPDPVVGQGGIQATEFFQAADQHSRAASLVSAALSTGSFGPAEYAQFVRLVNVYHDIVETPASVVPPHVLDRVHRITATEHWQRLTDVENRLIEQGPWRTAQPGARSPVTAPPVSLQEWQDLSQQMSKDLHELTILQADYASMAGWNQGIRNMLIVAAITVVAIIAVVVAIRQSRRNATALNRRFEFLQNDMEDVSNVLLPAAFERIGRGELPDATSALTQQNYGSDEIAAVKESFDGVVKIALQSSIDQAEIQEGMKTVLVGMARRTKIPIRNGVNTIDKLVEFEELPDDVRDLVFELDQELTRIRRHNENVLILGGEEPGRGWSKPVALPQVVRAAGDETEHYARVHYENIPKVAIVPSAVADVMHLLAELIDNATSFSRSMVRVQGQKWVSGVLVIVEDQGIGMTQKDLDAANELFAGRSRFDLLKLRNSDRKGHFVVTLLAAKHGIKVELAQMYLGGTRATVAIPDRIIERRDSPTDAPQNNDALFRQLPADNATASPSISRRRPQPAQVDREAGPATRPVSNGRGIRVDPSKRSTSGQHRRHDVETSVPSQITRRIAAGVERFSGDLLGAVDPAPTGSTPVRPSASEPTGARPEDGKRRRPLPTRVPQASLDTNLLDELPSPAVASEQPQAGTRTAREAADRLRGAYMGRRKGNPNGEDGQ